MPLDAERSTPSVTFTEEAELALERELKRTERRLRAKAIEESIRSRGFPAEVTGTDIARASKDLSPRQILREERFPGRFLHPEIDVPMDERSIRIQAKAEAEERQWKKTGFYKISTLYFWLGFATAIIGLFYPLLHRILVNINQSPLWRQSALICASGVMLMFVGLFFRSQFRKRYRRGDVH
jgi:hypothetical protein